MEGARCIVLIMFLLIIAAPVTAQTFNETVAMYMKSTKQELAEMLAARDTRTYTDHKMSDTPDFAWTFTVHSAP